LQAEPDLARLDEGERPLVARALAKDPAQRYPSCRAFIRALQGKPLVSLSDFNLDAMAPELSLVPEPSALPSRLRPQALAQTPGNKSAATELTRCSKVPTALPPRLAGYRFVATQASSLLADVWKATAPDGREYQVKCIYGLAGRDLRSLQETAQRLQALQHPA